MPSPSETAPPESATASSDSGGDSSDPDPVSWSHTPEESRLLRALVAVPLGVVGGTAVAVAVGSVAFAVGLLLSGKYGVGVALLAALAVVALRFAPQYVAFRREESSWALALPETLRRLGPAGVAAASVLGLAVVWVGLQFGAVGFFAVVFGTVAVPALVASVLSSEGDLDPETGILTYSGTDIDLSSLSGFRRISLGAAGVVVYRFSYVSGATTYRTPRFVVVPAAVDGPLRDAVSAGVVAEADDYDPTNPAIRATLAVFGVGLLGFAGLVLTVEPTSQNFRGGVVLVYTALLSGVFGVLFLSLAVRSG